MSKIHGFVRGEEGITALETAIILIAFVVVASVFAFTILSAGTYATERGKEAVYAGLEEVQGTMELRGSVVAQGVVGDVVTTTLFTLGNVAGGSPVDLTLGANKKIVIDYRDQTQLFSNIEISIAFTIGDGDDLLEEGELALFTVPLNGQYVEGWAVTTTTGVDANIGTNTEFSLEIKPPNGPVILLERTTPAYIDTVMDLH